MGSVNKVILVGNLGRDPEVRYTTGGQAVANFTLATNEYWMKKDGQKQEDTEWHRIVAWGKLGEFCGKFLSKGKQIYIEGRLRTREWQDKNGQMRYTTEIHAQRLQLLGRLEKAASNFIEEDGSSKGSGYSEPGPVQINDGGHNSDFSAEEDVPF